MPLLPETVARKARDQLRDLTGPVRLAVFTQEIGCQSCRENTALALEAAGLSSRISAEVYDFQLDQSKVRQYAVDKIPCIVVEGARDYGIRFYGAPGGYEFASLLEAIKAASSGDSGLLQSSREALREISLPVHVQVFVTLTCPYCPHAVRLAHRAAVESDMITADMVDSAQFPHLANKYGVYSVPKVIVSEITHFEGALPENEFIDRIVRSQAKRAG